MDRRKIVLLFLGSHSPTWAESMLGGEEVEHLKDKKRQGSSETARRMGRLYIQSHEITSDHEFEIRYGRAAAEI